MANPSWQTTKKYVHRRAGGCCEYCQTYEINIGQAMHVEHIDPAGGDDPDNLCLACPNCNLSKAAAMTAIDTETGAEVLLFDPRSQLLNEHFVWRDDHALIWGLTPVGRATVARFNSNGRTRLPTQGRSGLIRDNDSKFTESSNANR